MSRSKLAIAAIAVLVLTACAKHELPVSVKQCDAVSGKQGSSVTVRIHNAADKPVRNVGMTMDFYNDFKFTRVTGVAIFLPGIEPGKDASALLTLANPKDATGNAQRCAVTHITYADGTQEETAVK
jgi:uncharacterized membrane protein